MEYKKSDKIHNFIISKINIVNNINSIIYQIKHKITNAKLIYVNNVLEKENLFSIAFKTPPINNAGIPHILEHCILCGSINYPSNNIFTDLLKSSMATFLNAMTYSDKTVYPFMSTNYTDYCNLMRVYCDAVFSPLLNEIDFKKESHYLINNATTNNKKNIKLDINGIVYNEMKGAYSDINRIIDIETVKSLFPNNIYSKDSGGNPNKILTSTHKQLKRYHKKYYHPSNSYIIVYGSLNIENILKILDQEYLSKFKCKKININIKDQNKFQYPIEKIIKYPINISEKKENKSIAIISFMTNNIQDILTTIAMQILDLYLLDNDSSPLKAKIIKSNICKSLIYSGYNSSQKNTYFSIGINGVKQSFDTNILLNIFTSICEDIINNGFDDNKMYSAFNKLKFEATEIIEKYPLKLMDDIYNCWIYNIEPLYFLKIKKYIRILEKIYKNNNKFYIEIIKKFIINNTHYSKLIFIPDENYNKKRNYNISKKIKKIENSLDDHSFNKIINLAKQIHINQKKCPNKYLLPKISIQNIESNPITLNTSEEIINDIPIISINMLSNQINYINIAFNFENIDNDLTNYLIIFKIILFKMGTKKYSFFEMEEIESNISSKINSEFIIEGDYTNANKYCPILLISAKSIQTKFLNMLDIIKKRLFETNFSDKDRIKKLLLEEKSYIENEIIYSGSTYAIKYAARNINKNFNLSEKLNGISKLEFLNKILNNFDNEIEQLINKMKIIQCQLLNKYKTTISIIYNKKLHYKYLKNWLQIFKAPELPNKQKIKFQSSNDNTLLITSCNISFNSIAMPLKLNMSNKYSVTLFAINNYLSYDYLWNEIREKGGAYGVRLLFYSLQGLFGFYTYRDPNIEKSYNTFLGLQKYINTQLNLNTETINDIITGAIKIIDTPIRPEIAAKIAILRHIKKINNKRLKQYRNHLFEITKDEIKSVFNKYFYEGKTKISMCTITNKENIKNIKNIKFNIKNIN